jgi:hypothetical protein
MRSEFFNQVKRNRQKFYVQMLQIKKEEASQFFVNPENKRDSQKSPRFSLPKLNVKIPEIQIGKGFKKLQVFCTSVYIVSKPYGQKCAGTMASYASITSKRIHLGYAKVNGVMSRYAELFQMFIYANLIEVFEDEPDSTSEMKVERMDSRNTPGHADNREHAAKHYELSENKTLGGWFSRIFGNIIISLELDDIQLSAVKQPVLQSDEYNLVEVNQFSYPNPITIFFWELKSQFLGLFHTIHPAKLFRRDYKEINKFL